jgi:subtilase family serine protease
LRGATPGVEIGGWNIRNPYECKSVKVSKPEARVGKPVAVTASIANTFLDGSPVEVYVAGKAVASTLVWARGGSEEKVTFTVELDKAGAHEVTIGNQTVSVLVR